MLAQGILFINQAAWYHEEMKKRTRRILFWVAVLVFAAASWIAALVAQGYKYDLATNRFVRTGAIAITANTDATLTVNDKPAPAMSFLSHRTGVNRLLPGVYAVRVAREGYTTWRKTATAQEGLLTDFPGVLIEPTDPDSQAILKTQIIEALQQSFVKSPKPVTAGSFTLKGTTLTRTEGDNRTILATGVQGFALADNDSHILWWTTNDVWVLWLTNTDYQPFRTEGEKHLISHVPSPIARAAFFPDHDHIAIDLGAIGYRIMETDTRDSINVITIK